MADVPEPVHLALKRIDTSRRIFFIATAVLFIVVLLLLGIAMTARFDPVYPPVSPESVDSRGAAKVQFLGIAAQMLFTGGCAALVAFHVTRMTKSVLHAIELARAGDSGTTTHQPPTTNRM
jgi:hypothetical protein